MCCSVYIMLVFRADYRVQTPHEIFYEVLSVAMSKRMHKPPAAYDPGGYIRN